MFKYLSTLGLIKDKEPWDEENIRQMLTKYRELKMKKFPFDYRQFMLEYSQFMTGR
jgi:cytochrome c556